MSHGDASTWNLLTSGWNGWKLIDPREVAGEVAYDLAVVALKLRGELSASAVGVRLAIAAGASPMRVQNWIKVASSARI